MLITPLFVMGSAVVGGTLVVSYTARAVMEAGLALTRGKTIVKEIPLSQEHQEHYTPPSLKLAAKTFVEEVTIPFAAMSIGVEEMCRSARDVFTESRRGADRLIQRMRKSRKEDVVVDAPSATASEEVAPTLQTI